MMTEKHFVNLRKISDKYSEIDQILQDREEELEQVDIDTPIKLYTQLCSLQNLNIETDISPIISLAQEQKVVK